MCNYFLVVYVLLFFYQNWTLSINFKPKLLLGYAYYIKYCLCKLWIKIQSWIWVENESAILLCVYQPYLRFTVGWNICRTSFNIAFTTWYKWDLNNCLHSSSDLPSIKDGGKKCTQIPVIFSHTIIYFCFFFVLTKWWVIVHFFLLG